ncbi:MULTISPECIES: TetR/AcrR family transcriptional regulator [unclassified Adlercreutzia]|uniref:TetR/AcrR family transcriptional regulator n=1 Tax=unclassified Adlercreutzia TaxID=2636013 RepID=UPI0013EAB994|nr:MULTISPECIES: TetR/AcrR family transcriptional regulator [unclassified Adlercreutzia]
MSKAGGNARERILDEAFALFGQKGYAATTVRDIAGAVGVKAASLYNHFSGKREVFDALVEREAAYVEDCVRSAGAIARPDDDPHAYAEAGGTALAKLVWDSYAPFFEDGRIRLFRRMLAISRYGDARCAELYRAVFVTRPIELQEAVFSHLVDVGVFRPCDVRLAAEQFHGPMLMAIDSEMGASDAKEFCERHLSAFNAAHEQKGKGR